MKHITILLASMLALTGCVDSAKTLYFASMPSELKDCKTFYLTNTDGQRLTVMRCPNSITSATVPEGKSLATAVVIDGVEYVKKESEKK
jgi:hypothetical protein